MTLAQLNGLVEQTPVAPSKEEGTVADLFALSTVKFGG